MRGWLGAIALAAMFAIPAGTAYWLMLGCGADPVTTTRGTTAAQFNGATPIALLNDLGAPVCSVEMGPSSVGAWGDNWLAEGEAIQPGAGRTFATRGDAQWDVRVFGCGGGGGPLAVATRIAIGGPTQISLRTMTATGGGAGQSSGHSGGGASSGSLYGPR